MFTIGFYKNSFLFWLVTTAVFYGLLSRLLPQSLADFNEESPSLEQQIIVSSNGKVTLGDKDISSALIPKKNSDLFLAKILDEPGDSFSYSNITITFPTDFPLEQAKVKPYLIHSYNPITNYYISQNILTVVSGPIDSTAIYSIKIDLPKGYIHYGFLKTIVSGLYNLSGVFWIAVAILLPLIALLIFLNMLFQQKSVLRQIQPASEINYLPNNLQPALVGVLLNNRVTNREITATLLDLARRGILEIYYKGSDFSFIKKINISFQHIYAKLPPYLQRFEFLIMSKIFTDKTYKSTQEDIVYRLGHRLFSDKIAKAYQEMYREITIRGYVVENPQAVHGKYKNWGLFCFFGGLTGVIVSAVLTPDPKFLSLFWVGMMLVGELIVNLASRMSLLTPKGIEALRGWLALKRFLQNPQPIKEAAEIYEKFLAYAVVFDVEKEWTARFRQSPFAPPKWFSSNVTERPDLVSFSQELFPLVNWIGTSLSQAKNPLID